MKLIFVAVLSLAFSTQSSWAGNCPHEYKPPVKHHVTPPKKKPPVSKPPVSSPPCACKGEQGPPGPKGDDGQYIIQVVQYEHRSVEYVAGMTPRLGVMGFLGSAPQHARRGDWGWGPALQLDLLLTERDHLTIDGGIAAPFNIDGSPGRQSGFLGHLGYTHFMCSVNWLGLTGGVELASFSGDSTNGNVSARYMGLDLGLVAQKDLGRFNLRAELTPVIGGLRDTYSPMDTQFNIGIAGSLFLGVNL